MSFTAAELEAAIEAREESEWDGYWGEIGIAYEPNPDFDPEAEVESKRLYEVWRNKRLNSWLPDDPDYVAYDTHRKANGSKLWPMRSCAPKVRVNGVEYDIKVVADHGGGEGSGEERWIVIEVGGRLFRKDGYYASYEGSTFDSDLREVRAVEKPVTFYE